MDAVYAMYKRMLKEHPNDFYDRLAAAAWKGCDSTKDMKPQ